MSRPIEPPTLSKLFAVALPMIASQASETVMLFVDRLFLSWLGKLHLAAAMSGGLSSFVFTALFAGVVGYTNALVAQYYGAGRKERCVETAAQGVYLSLFFVPLLLGLIPLVRLLFVAIGHTPEQVALEFGYFRILMWGGAFVLLRQALVGFFLGIGKTRVVMAANVAGMLVNVPLNYALIFGNWGAPALGMTGAAIGTIAGSVTIFVILLVAYTRHSYYCSYGNARRWAFRPDVALRLVRFGLPAGTELFLNVFAFNLFVQLMHSLGPDVAAAVTITFNYDMLAFIPMVGLGVAVTSLVGRHMGAGDPAGAQRATFLALRVGYVYASIMMTIFILGADPLVRVFAGGLEAGDEHLLVLARSMLRLAALYTLADITQLVFAGALRGAGDTRWLMIASVVLHWLMAISAFYLARVLTVPPLRLWILFISMVMALGLTIFARFATGKWKLIRVIEELPPDLAVEAIAPDAAPIPAEAKQPEISTEAGWM